jgi:hypothetical protein
MPDAYLSGFRAVIKAHVRSVGILLLMAGIREGGVGMISAVSVMCEGNFKDTSGIYLVEEWSCG